MHGTERLERLKPRKKTAIYKNLTVRRESKSVVKGKAIHK